MKTYRWLLLGSLLLFGSTAHAEGECPPGMFPTNPPGAQGPVGCAPIPGYDQQQQQAQPQQPMPPPPQWATQWGAVATDSIKGSLGAAAGMASRDEATQKAIGDCQSKGGTSCKINVAYSNECAVMMVGSAGYNFGADASLDKATQSAMKKCREADTNCHVYYSACSMPVRIK